MSSTLCVSSALFLTYMKFMGMFKYASFVVSRLLKFIAIMPEMLLALAVFLLAIYLRDVCNCYLIGSYSLIIWVKFSLFFGTNLICFV